jgi:hypothetical protein
MNSDLGDDKEPKPQCFLKLNLMLQHGIASQDLCRIQWQQGRSDGNELGTSQEENRQYTHDLQA